MTAGRVLLSLDQGTTSSRAMLFSKNGDVIGTRQNELRLITPQDGWVEQDPEDIWRDTLSCAQALIKDYPEEAGRIASIGIANQRETTILWDRKTGKPVYNAIVWQDRRTAEMCAGLKARGAEDIVSAKTGLLIDPYFSATKIAWILENVEGARARAEAGDIAFGTVDCFLLWRLTRGRVHATDVTNASRTMLFDVVKNRWDEALLTLFGIPAAILPEVRDNTSDFGATDPDMLGRSHTIGGMAGDQQAALFGQACFHEGMVKSTYGTGCFALMNIGDAFRRSENRLLTTVGYRLGGRTTYAVEGAIFVAGAAIQWLRDALHLFRDASDTDAMARSVGDSGGVTFVPAFTGLGAPFWRPEARGVISGLGRGTTSAHIVRATLEAQGFQTRDLMAALAADGKCDPSLIRADGGLTANAFMCQFLADMIGKPVEIPRTAETTALGAAFLAGLQTGIYGGLDEIEALWQCDRRYAPTMEEGMRDASYRRWMDAVSKI